MTDRRYRVMPIEWAWAAAAWESSVSFSSLKPLEPMIFK